MVLFGTRIIDSVRIWVFPILPGPALNPPPQTAFLLQDFVPVYQYLPSTVVLRWFAWWVPISLAFLQVFLGQLFMYLEFDGGRFEGLGFETLLEFFNAKNWYTLDIFPRQYSSHQSWLWNIFRLGNPDYWTFICDDVWSCWCSFGETLSLSPWNKKTKLQSFISAGSSR